jgi:hypothetical protein
LHVNVACPVSVRPSAAEAVIVIGFATAAVQVAVTCVVGVAEKWTDGSLDVQFEGTSAAEARPAHAGLLLNLTDALNIWPLEGARAVWSTVAEAGPTFKPTVWQGGVLEPPHPVKEMSVADKRTLKKLFIVKSVRGYTSLLLCSFGNYNALGLKQAKTVSP